MVAANRIRGPLFDLISILLVKILPIESFGISISHMAAAKNDRCPLRVKLILPLFILSKLKLNLRFRPLLIQELTLVPDGT